MKTVYFPNIALNALDAIWDDRVNALGTKSRVEEDSNGYYVQIEVPGFSKEDIKISLIERELSLEGERKGRFGAKFRKAFSLPDDVDTEKITAQTKDGILELALTKVPIATPKSIPVVEAKDSFFKQIESK